MILSNLFQKNKTKQNLEAIESVKAENNQKLDATVRRSVANSRQAGIKFDKIGVEMQSIANDTTIRIAEAIGKMQL